ncbi:TaqI-like C-terminal specificity domain-containing protein [Butyrivibrio sp. AE3009]|uniref:TaqI-like C-terminal specificity domain-containing protein n=1 Tax=Butyrivibrio sp. AE3009 TaxID=1280666 RepID=UPI0003B708E9|nr:TaqI-like C-terminal specificity domain-containing protein [Butyrivibrio sp. AE3009]
MALKNAEDNSILTVKQASEILGICTATLKNWIKLGKIPATSRNNHYYLSDKDVTACAKALETGSTLRSRRNKRLSDSNFIPRSYIDSSSGNYRAVIDIVNSTRTSQADTEDILSFYSAMLMRKSGLSDSTINQLISDISSDITGSKTYTHDEAFSYELIPVPGEDTLGMLYLSLRGLRSKKATGSYYTPFYAVDLLCRSAFAGADIHNKTICDPACGTGNFLIRLPKIVTFDNIHGYDIDPIAIALARINVAIRYHADDKKSLKIICDNIRVADFLSEKCRSSYDIIIGNPPWGYSYSPKEIARLKKSYRCAVTTGRPESFSLFTEKALSVAKEVTFLIPETFLESDAHRNIRNLILDTCSVKKISYLGEIFDKVQCPCIILSIIRAVDDSNNIEVSFYKRSKNRMKESRSFLASSNRLSSSSFQIICDDTKYRIILKMQESDHFCLKDNADFALGIVTGNNKQRLLDTPSQGYEGIIKGTDIDKFRLKEPSSFVQFDPGSFQQVAPVQYYRDKNKLFYKFIAPEPVVAPDDKGYVSLNSANILIPRKEGYSARYIMAVLNSSCISFYYRNTCRNMKVLRARLEALPIPVCDDNVMKEIEALTYSNEGIMELNLKVAALFGLKNEEIQVISDDY